MTKPAALGILVLVAAVLLGSRVAAAPEPGAKCADGDACLNPDAPEACGIPADLKEAEAPKVIDIPIAPDAPPLPVEDTLKANWTGEYFPGFSAVKYEGPDSKNPLAFHYYNAEEEVMGKPMHEWLRFALAFWHTMRGDGSDPFGHPTKKWPWEDPALDQKMLAYRRMEAFFELATKLGIRYWCFHDRDISPVGGSLSETNLWLDQLTDHAAELQKATGVKTLWGTADLFKHPRYMHGAATSPNASVFAYAAAQVKKAMEVTHKLGGENYVFWGGREGYHTLLNTNLTLEMDNLGRFMRMASAWNKKNNYNLQLLLEPKPQEPTKHQYDFDVATTTAFLLRNGLDKEFKLNLECNHATLAGHSCEHEAAMASAFGVLGSLDANTGDPQVGWDTDQFLTDAKTATLVMEVILKQGGLAPGGINFDAKLRRESISLEDLFYGHISGMDAMARGLRNAARMIEEGELDRMRRERYSSYFDDRIGRDIVDERADFRQLEAHAMSQYDPGLNITSGQAELYDLWLAHYLR